MYYTYILKSEASGKHYYGHTQDLQEHIIRHNENRELATKNRGPWKLNYRESFPTWAEAMQRE